MKYYTQLKNIFKKLAYLQYTQKIMMWDEAVMMPEGAGSYRAKAMAALDGFIQKILVQKKTKALIESAKNEYAQLSAWDQANFRWMEKKHMNASCIPPALIQKLTQTKMLCEQAWRRLRLQNNWQDFLPYLENTFILVKEQADRQAQVLNIDPYDALLDKYAPGFTQASIDHIFSDLKQSIPPLVKQIRDKQASESVKLPQGPFSIEKQKAIGLKVMAALQFDFNYGRLDNSHHPFCNGISEDVRITTRYSQDEFITSLLGICHETGHALYEQGLPKKWISQPVGIIHSMAMHESQSLLIEMQVCRSSEYFQFLQPIVQEQFGEQAAFSADNLFKLVTRVKPSLIRVDADEVTYPLHVIMRYEIEKGLFKGDITISDLPHYWDECMRKYLGLSTKGNDRDGVMQDVHWPSGAFGYFPAYTLGRIIAAQFYAAFNHSSPHFKDEIKCGNFNSLITWLRQYIHGSASSLNTSALLRQTSGQDLDSSYFINHIKQRYLGVI